MCETKFEFVGITLTINRVCHHVVHVSRRQTVTLRKMRSYEIKVLKKD